MTYAERAIRYKIAGEMAKILLIEDEELVRNTLCDVLQLAGHDVDEADNGATGTMLHKTQSYDLVITDIIMPDKEGIGAIIDILEKNPTQKIIAISGGGRLGAEGYLESAATFGASATLAKPFTDKELINSVTACLEQTTPA